MPVTDAQLITRDTLRTPALAHARVAVTGRLATVARPRLVTLVESRGGTYAAAVSRATTHLVVGMDGWPLAHDGGVSAKLRRADELNERGAAIEIVPEAAFLEHLGVRSAATTSGKSIPAEHVMAATGVDASTLRRWEFAGLVRAHNGHFDFRDLLSLRTLAELVAEGVAPDTIARSVRGLANVLPGTDRPLAQLRFVVEHGASLLGEVADALLDPNGQFVFDFDPDADRGRPASAGASDGPDLPAVPFPDGVHGAARSSGPGTPSAPSAEQAFEAGVDSADRGRLDRAETAYRQAIAQRPEFPEAHLNLGTVLRQRGSLREAETHLRFAIAQAPDFAETWIELADLLAEVRRVDEAVICLERAVVIAPDAADAHFNLAALLERQGRHREALPHWRVYLEFDALSAWADVARARLGDASTSRAGASGRTP